ncbi:hypothetical protein D9757_013282 [Collybiopsis confluens]|uniref:Kinesin light chain n=1 Tax=Collybiopsis confluens TaxID=2823264 RepID=A0A8H5G6J0_9AGAR|nr:hypothetical protein D9757_013282 [Collybiopsis confluens]
MLKIAFVLLVSEFPTDTKPLRRKKSSCGVDLTRRVEALDSHRSMVSLNEDDATANKDYSAPHNRPPVIVLDSFSVHLQLPCSSTASRGSPSSEFTYTIALSHPSGPSTLVLPPCCSLAPAVINLPAKTIIIHAPSTVWSTGGNVIECKVGEIGRRCSNTCLAAKYLRRAGNVCRRFSKIYFIHSSSEHLIKASYYDIAKENKVIKPTWEAGRDWLQTYKEEWMVLFDNVDDPDLQLGALLPRSSHGNIIITSRNEALSLLTEKSQKLVDLETEDAIQLLLKHAIKPPDMVSMADKQNAAEIVRELYYFPLAIAQAGAYICQEKCLGNYVDQLHKQKGLLNKTVPQVVDVYSLTVYSTWDLSWEKLDESTKSFLRVCSQLHYEQIPTLLFERAEKNLETFGVRFEPSQAVSAAKQFFNETQLRPWGNERFEQIITQLRSYSLLSVHEQGIYSIHPLVHYWIEDNLDLENQIYSKLQAQGILAAGIWNMTSWRDQRFAKMAALHAILKNLFYNGEYPIQVAGRELFFQTSNFKEALKLAKCFTYSNLEKYENALKLLHPLVKIFTRVLGAEHPNTLDAIQDLAWTYAQSSNYCKALDLQAPLLPVYQQKMGQEHPLTLQVAHDLSETFFYLGRHNDALNLQRPLFETSQAILGANHPDTISKMFILARTLYCSSGSTEALQLVKSAIEKSKHILGDGHPETLKRVQYLNILHIQLESTPEGNQGKRKDRLIEKFRYYLTKGHPKVK